MDRDTANFWTRLGDLTLRQVVRWVIAAAIGILVWLCAAYLVGLALHLALWVVGNAIHMLGKLLAPYFPALLVAALAISAGEWLATQLREWRASRIPTAPAPPPSAP